MTLDFPLTIAQNDANDIPQYMAKITYTLECKNLYLPQQCPFQLPLLRVCSLS